MASREVALAGLVALFLLSPSAHADEPKPAPVVPLVSLRGKMPFGEALQGARRQSGVTLTDALGKKAPEVSLDLDKLHFWPAIDRLAREANAKVIQSPRDGSVVFHPFTHDDRRPRVSYDGPFRVRVTRITTTREFDSDRGSCVVGLEVTWTPTLRPLFLDSQPQRVRFQVGEDKLVSVPDEGGSLVPVDGRFAFPMEITLPALPREQKHLRSLEGRFSAVVPTKMLTFAFEGDLAHLDDVKQGKEQRKLTAEGVACQVWKITLGAETWSVQIRLDYPEGNRPLESFQAASLVANNELVLTSKDGKRKLLPSNSVVDQVGSRRALVTYHFSDRPGAARGKAVDWMPAYAAPARIVEVPVRFAFEELPLP